MKKKKYLLLFTDFYPFEKWEPYLKNEMNYLPGFFKDVFIFCNYKQVGQPIYPLPDNVHSYQFNNSLSAAGKIYSIRFFFSPVFWEEVKMIRRSYKMKFSLSVMKILLIALASAARWEKMLRKFLERENLIGEEIIAYSFWADSRAIAAAKLAVSKNIRSVSRAHGWDVYFERHHPPLVPFRKFLHDHLHGLFFVSENGREYSLKKIRGSESGKFRTAYLGTEFLGRNPDELKKEFVMVSCAHMVALKRIPLIAEILVHLDFDVRWIHFGDGAERVKDLNHIGSLLKNKKNITFDFRGEIDNEALHQFYLEQHVDLFITTSAYEGMPMSIMEALSFGIPVMATDVGGIREVVNDLNGVLLEKFFDPSAASEWIRNFFSLSLEMKNGLRESAFQTWKLNFNAEVNYPKFANEILKF